MRLKMMLFASVLILVGLVIFLYGTSMGNNVLNPESLISGTYLAVVGVFLAIAGFLMLVSHVFRGRSMFY